MPFQKWQANGVTIDPPTTTINFDGVTATKSDDVTTIQFGGDITGVTAGAGLTGGGASGSVTLDVAANADGTITVNANDIQVSAAALTGTQVAVNAAANVIGSIPVVHRIVVPAGTTGNVDVTLTHKTLVTDAWLYKTAAAGGGGGTIQVFNGASAISDAMSIDINDKAVARATAIDDAANLISAAGTLRITRTRTASSDESCVVFVAGLRSA